MKPLDGLLVLDFSQFLAGPSAALRLADLGARVIKIERPIVGDLCRQLYNTDVELDGDSTLFHTINRNKESIDLNLKDPDDLEVAKALIKKADVMIENFRPGVIERLGLSYDVVCELNPRLVYAEITGYGHKGPWRTKPGQDLLVQAISGLTWLNGNADMPPTPMGLAIVDMFAGAYAVQGILACLVRRGITNQGGLVQVNMLESSLDFQFEAVSTFLNDNGRFPQRSAINNANPYLPASYGIYKTADGHLALAMGSISHLGKLLNCTPLAQYPDEASWLTHRDEVKQILKDHLKTQPTQFWLDILEPQDIWCADVFDWNRLFAHEGFQVLDMVQEVARDEQVKMKTLRCPIRINGERLYASKGAPRIGQHTDKILHEFELS
ncbi:MAG: CoA transferase [Chloroflexi bacterium]|nr:MAG: CoA transferase [Chloroflexota bacterium]